MFKTKKDGWEKEAIDNMRNELEGYVKRAGLKSLVLGVSGGIDSALIAALAAPVCEKLGIELIGISIPIKTNKDDEIDRAKQIGFGFCTQFKEESMDIDFDTVSDIISVNNTDFAFKSNSLSINELANQKQNKIRQGNIKARLRMIMLYDIASATKGMVLSTDNYTEYLLGFWTLHGDVGDYGLIQKLWKTEVYQIAHYIFTHELTGNPQQALLNCIRATATDGLGITNSDIDQIMPEFKGTSKEGYEEVDKMLYTYCVAGNKIFEADPVIQRHLKSAFKRHNPFNISRELIIKE